MAADMVADVEVDKVADIGNLLKQLREVFLGDLSQICLSIHLPFFGRFGITKSEIRVEKGPHLGEITHKKTFAVLENTACAGRRTEGQLGSCT